MNFGVLGALQVTNGDHVVALAVTPKARLLLTVLLADAGRPVSVDGLVHAVWGPRPPRSARRNAQLYVHKLRSLLGAEVIATAADSYLFTRADGVDAIRFTHRFKAGTAALRAGDPAASGLLRSALDLWRGPAYAGFLGCEPVADQARRLEEQRLCAYERWAQACVAAHRYEEVVDDLPPLVRA
ncbi:MAG: SARP family transcriptional regulator, partial [Streptomycetaceae bacterium]|nr:SARP family transcriptional regulator [Streptomycetaceae bacterium]